jgi:hypothetical protein
MPMPFRTSRLSAFAAISVAAACAIGANASAQVLTPLLIGPNRVGSAVTYRLTTSGGRAGNTPSVQTLALRWKLGAKVVVTLASAGDAQAPLFIATRAADGTLTLDNASGTEPEGQGVAAALGLLNRLDGFVAAAPAGAKTWKTTLVVQQPPPGPPPAPDAQSMPAPQPMNIPIAATRSDDATGTTFAASGSIDHTITRPGPAGGDAPRGGGMGGGRRGGMGGGGMGGSSGSSSGRKSAKVTTKIAVDAHFGVDGELTSGSIVETNRAAGDPNQQNQQNGQSQPLTRSWQIERMP